MTSCRLILDEENIFVNLNGTTDLSSNRRRCVASAREEDFADRPVHAEYGICQIAGVRRWEQDLNL